MKNKKLIKILSNISLIIGVALFAYYLFVFFTSRSNLPANVCPFDTARPFAYAAAGFLVVSLVLSFFEEKKPKKQDKE